MNMTMVPTPASLSRPSTCESTGNNNLNDSSQQLNVDPDSPVEIFSSHPITPKARNKFTLPSSPQKINNIMSPSSMKYLDEEEKARKQVEDDLSKGIVTRTIVYEDPPADSPENGSTSSTQLIKKPSAIHGSMENIFRPKNHSINFKKSETSSNEPTTPYSELKSAKSKTKSLWNSKKESFKQPICSNSLLLSNETMLKALDNERRRILMHKVMLAFVTSGMKRKNRLIDEMQDQIISKAQECAARLILHHLLLNAWRHGQQDILKLQEENVQLNRTSENFCLQLRVVRHLQSSDKYKIVDQSVEINTLKTEINRFNEEITRRDTEAEKVEGELNELQYKVEILNQEKYDIQMRMKHTREKNEMLMHSLELEKKRCNNLEGKILDLRRQENELKKEVREITAQSSQWQEKLKASESDIWELKLQIESRDKNVSQLQESCSTLQKESQGIIKEKSQLESKFLKTKEALAATIVQKAEVEESTKQLEKELDSFDEVVDTLENELHAKNQECKNIFNELQKHAVENVARRRAWTKALYYVFNPFDAVKVLISK